MAQQAPWQFSCMDQGQDRGCRDMQALRLIMDFTVEGATIYWQKFICGCMKLGNGTALKLPRSSVRGWGIMWSFRWTLRKQNKCKDEQGSTGRIYPRICSNPINTHITWEIFKPVTSQHTKTQQCILRHHFHRFIPSPPWQLSKSLFSFMRGVSLHTVVLHVIHEMGGTTAAGDAAPWQVFLEGLPRCGRVSRELTGLRELALLSLLKRQIRGDLFTADMPSQGDTSAVTLSWRESNSFWHWKSLRCHKIRL